MFFSSQASDLLALANHELRTPLSGILGFAGLLDERVYGALNDKQAEAVQTILACGHQLLARVEAILDVASVDGGCFTLEVEPFDAAIEIRSMVGLSRTPAAARQITLDHEQVGPLGILRADPRAFRKILSHLLENAVKLTPPGGSIAVAARRRPDGGIELLVTNSGLGISADDLPRLFRCFAERDSPLERRHGGLGLGLALTRRLVELHGGTIGVTSAPGTGTVFTMALPNGPTDTELH